MKIKIVWICISLLMVLSLVVASCGTTTVEEEEEEEEEVVIGEEEEEEKEEVVEKKKEMVKDSLGNMVEKPQYGGTFSTIYSREHSGWDEFYVTPNSFSGYGSIVFKELITGDWSRGPGGTDEFGFNFLFYPNPHWSKGEIAESWEIEMPDTITYNIRKGVRFSFNPELEASRMVGGREITAEDIVYNLRTYYIDEPKSKSYGFALESAPIDVYATDKWTVVVKSLPGHAWLTHRFASMVMKHNAPEVRQKYGDCVDWKRAIGTGPYMLVDDVAGSVSTLAKNPNYWEKDPLIPENQLPYIDTVKMFYITDASTRLAAVRTRKVDRYSGLTWEDKIVLEKSNPELIWSKYAGCVMLTCMRLDKPELPFKDINVRRALMIGINYQEIIDIYYGGWAEIFEYPVSDHPIWEEAYTPLDELGLAPDGFDTKKIYDYNPEEAKRLLAEAGYPNGFKTKIQISPAGADFYSMIAAYWKEIGVDLKIEAMESGALSKITYGKLYDELMQTAWPSDGTAGTFEICRPGCMYNFSLIDDPVITEGYDATSGMVPFYDEWFGKVKELALYQAHKVWYLDALRPYQFVVWYPWLKRYDGELNLTEFEHWGWIQYVWLDQELKKEMGY